MQNFLNGIRAGDTLTLMTLIGVFVGVMIVVALIVNISASRRSKKAPPPEWGSKSARYRK